MTESSRRNDSRTGAANLAPVLMILAFAAMAGFLWWLGATSEGTSAMIMTEDTAEVADTTGQTAVQVTPDQLRQAQQFEGQEVRIGAQVASPVGSQAFFLDLPQSPFLVKLPAGVSMPDGEVVVTGTVHAMTDSIIDAWSEEGTISAGDRPIVEFATHFIEARQVRARSGQDDAAAGQDTTQG